MLLWSLDGLLSMFEIIILEFIRRWLISCQCYVMPAYVHLIITACTICYGTSRGLIRRNHKIPALLSITEVRQANKLEIRITKANIKN